MISPAAANSVFITQVDIMEIYFNQIKQQNVADTMWSAWQVTEAIALEFEEICISLFDELRLLEYEYDENKSVGGVLAKIKEDLFMASFGLREQVDFLNETIDEYSRTENEIVRIAESIVNTLFDYSAKALPITANPPAPALPPPADNEDVRIIEAIQTGGIPRSADIYKAALDNMRSDHNSGDLNYIRSVGSVLGLPDIFAGVKNSGQAVTLLKNHAAENGWFGINHQDASEMALEGYPVMFIDSGYAAFYYPSGIISEDDIANKAEFFVHI